VQEFFYGNSYFIAPFCRLLKFLYEFESLNEFFVKENRRLSVCD